MTVLDIYYLLFDQQYYYISEKKIEFYVDEAIICLYYIV